MARGILLGTSNYLSPGEGEWRILGGLIYHSFSKGDGLGISQLTANEEGIIRIRQSLEGG